MKVNAFRANAPYLTDAVISAMVGQALAEDIGGGDITAGLIDSGLDCTAVVIARESGVLCGSDWFNSSFHQLNQSIIIDWSMPEGAGFRDGQVLCRLHGSARDMLTAERTGLNFLQFLSGVATRTRRYCDALTGSRTRLLDTRKTIPGLRLAQKYAVLVGGGENHRIGLFDAVLVKENHIAAAGSIPRAVQKTRQNAPESCMIEVEVENEQQLESALQAGVTRIMLDNFSIDGINKAVRMVAGRAELEASGDINLENIHDYARTGVDFISIGALTKHIKAIDFSMRFKYTDGGSDNGDRP